jgi:hypothetical protein
VADKVLSFDLGRDVELAFLQGGPIIKKVVDLDDNTEQAELTGSLTETVRVRLATHVALGMIFNLINTLVEGGRIKVPALREALLQVASEKNASEASE